MDFPNRQALARQGFYGDEYVVRDRKDTQEKKPCPKASAAEKRRQFQNGVRSRSKNWSLTEDTEEPLSHPRDWKRSVDSWDRGFILKSFSDRFSSDSSLEDMDGFQEEKRTLNKQNSISNLRKQYQETIRQSIDGDYPVFQEEDSSESERSEKSAGITEMRKKQVDRLMLSIDDDGDYVNHLKIGAQKGNLKLAQKSTQSTITGSPHTPKDVGFSFDEENVAELTAQQSSPENHDHGQPVSIIVEESNVPLESIQQRVTNPAALRTQSHELSLSLGSRSDSCHTLVPQDSNYEADLNEGDLTPRVGDTSPGLTNQRPSFGSVSPIQTEALSESSSSISTLKNLTGDGDIDDLDGSQVMRSRSEREKNSLKPQVVPPQESFELEEVILKNLTLLLML